MENDTNTVLENEAQQIRIHERKYKKMEHQQLQDATRSKKIHKWNLEHVDTKVKCYRSAILSTMFYASLTVFYASIYVRTYDEPYLQLSCMAAIESSENLRVM